MDELKQQMQEFSKDFFGSDNFKFDPKQMDELQKQMDQFNQGLKPESFKLDMDTLPKALQKPEPQPRTFEDMMRDQQKHERDELKRQMEEVQVLGLDHLA